MSLFPTKEDKAYERGFRAAENHWKERAEAAEARVKELDAALESIAVYGCGMLNQPAALNGPEEDWLRRRIREYERVARAALDATRTTKGGEE